MKKQMMALAVAGALAAPVSALAQTQIYGLFNAEWGIGVDQPKTGAGAERATGEGFNSGASRIGFRGEEKLGGGNSAWYQCESEIGLYPRDTGITWCDRNSAVGLKGSWGNFFVGTWDSPLKRASGIVRITNETGWLGSQDMTLRNTTGGLPNFSSRNTNSFNYDTPDMGGFMASLQVTTKQATIDAVDTDVVDGRRITASVQYVAGPLALIAAYAKHEKNRSQGGTENSEDKAWAIGGSYVIGPVKVGLTAANRETDDGAGTTIERRAYNLAADFRVSGSGTIRAGFALSDDLEGTTKVANSGAKQYQISYLHALSKRTTLTVGYVKLDNDTAGTHNLTDLSTDVLPGSDASAFVLSLAHSF
jgi:predicted porin